MIYEIRGNLNGDTCIWYLKDYKIVNDTIVFNNLDSTQNRINPPYIINKKPLIFRK
jgi:hypothetical protein